MGFVRRTAKLFFVVVVVVNLVAVMAYAAGIRINITKSIPLGFYRTSSEEIKKGSYVFFCPPDWEVFSTARERGYLSTGYCPGRYSYMMKKVLATEGDTVSTSDAGLSVNSSLLAHSKYLDVDAEGRSLPEFFQGVYRLGEAELLLMSDVNSRSFDGRYFGPISSSQVKSVITPVVTWE